MPECDLCGQRKPSGSTLPATPFSRAMARRGVTAADVAKGIGVSRASVWSWMSGLRRRPTAKRIKALATWFDLSESAVASWFRSTSA